MNRKQSSINSEIVLLCERQEIAEFMPVYLKYLFKQGLNLSSVQIINCHAFNDISSIAEKLPLVPGSEQIRKTVFLADAVPGELQKRKSMLNAVRSSTYFSKMEYCAHFFFPGKRSPKRWQQGYFEDMLLQSLDRSVVETGAYQNFYNLTEEYLLCVNNSRGQDKPLCNHSRHLLYGYFAATENFVGMHLGEAALHGAFNLNHSAFDDLKDLLKQL